MRREDVLNCQFQEWYPNFREVTFRSEILKLPEDFIQYLLEDGIFLPSTSEAMPRRSRFSEWEGEESAVVEDDDEDEPVVPTFLELEDQVRAAIERLGGSVLPKLNWSSPKDAQWINPSGSMRCCNPGEIFLLLKSSDRVSHDLCFAFDACTIEEAPPSSSSEDGQISLASPSGMDITEPATDGHEPEESGASAEGGETATAGPDAFYLVLRRWFDLRPEMEFRCFVRGQRLLGVSQREVTSFYPSLVQQQQQYKDLIIQFFEENIRHKFRNPDYVFDVYITRALKVKLVDFNPYGATTLPLLFTWEELDEISSSQTSDDAQQLTGFSLPSTEGEIPSHTLSSTEGEITNHIPPANRPLSNGHASHSEASQTSDRARNGMTRQNADMEQGLEITGGVLDSSSGDDVAFRVIEVAGGVQPGLRAALGVPLDLVDRSPGSAMDDFLMHIREEAENELRVEMASGG